MVFNFCPKSQFSSLCPTKDLNCQTKDTVLPQKQIKVVRVRKLLPGERVVAKNYSGEGNWKLGRVEKVIGTLHLIKLDNGILWGRHIDQLRSVGENTPITSSTNYNTQCDLDINSENKKLQRPDPEPPTTFCAFKSFNYSTG